MRLVSSRHLFTAAFVGLFVSAAAAPPARAQSVCDNIAGNLLFNCGFETGDFTNWTLNGNGGFTGVYSGTFGGVAPNSGTYAAYMGSVGSDGYLSQTVATVAGHTYEVSLYWYSFGYEPSDLTVSFAGVDFLGPMNPVPATPSWQFAEGFITGTGSDVFTITNRNDPSYQLFDDASVVDVSVTPEPATLLLLGTGLGLAGIGGAIRRRRQKNIEG